MDKRFEELKNMEFMELRNQPDVHLFPTWAAKSKGSSSNFRAAYYVPKEATFFDITRMEAVVINKEGKVEIQALSFLGYY